MKMKTLLIIFILGSADICFGQNNNVGIGTLTPAPSALLDIDASSTNNKGVLIPRMTANQRLAITNPANSLLVFDTDSACFFYWNAVNASWQSLCSGNANANGFTHYIGELYGGGIVVSVWKIGGIEHGLIASLTDVSTSSVWSNVSTTLIGVTAQNPRDGQANSNSIIAQTGHTTSAAQLCDSYTAGGYSDWYLPAGWELNLCYYAATIVNEVLGDTNGFQSSYYWASSEYGATDGWIQTFPYGGTGATSKATNRFVRAVRRF